MRYLQADENSVIDYNTWKFKLISQLNSEDEIDVPYYLWSRGNGPALRTEHGTFGCISRIRLNRLSIDFNLSPQKVTVMLDNGQRIFDVSCKPITVAKAVRGRDYSVLAGIDFYARSGGQTFQDYISYDIDGHNFDRIPGLGTISRTNYFDDTLCYGIRSIPWAVNYKCKLLSGESLAILLGAWGILLTDDLKFDSMFLLKGVTDRLIVNSFVYTVNPYVTKVIYLNR